MCLSTCKLSTKEGHIVPLPKNMSPLTLHITDDLPITIKWLKRYREKIMVTIIKHAMMLETLGLGWKKLVLIEF